MSARLGKLEPRPADLAFLVQEFVPGGVEVFAGVSRDPDFGLSLAFGMGGIAIEVMRDFALRMLPLRDGDAEAMIAETRGAALLGAVRGGEAADVKSLAACLYALGDFASHNADQIAEIDLNPIKVLPQGRGVIVVDALIVARPDAGIRRATSACATSSNRTTARAMPSTPFRSTSRAASSSPSSARAAQARPPR